ncbi:hypothetical protein C8R45DRAFT_1158203 [Mycena sanguinolenta]|nr:hypothetical protein C8R45DRAFT_1158203 [Mycena sanguinolenta]
MAVNLRVSSGETLHRMEKGTGKYLTAAVKAVKNSSLITSPLNPRRVLYDVESRDGLAWEKAEWNTIINLILNPSIKIEPFGLSKGPHRGQPAAVAVAEAEAGAEGPESLLSSRKALKQSGPFFNGSTGMMVWGVYGRAKQGAEASGGAHRLGDDYVALLNAAFFGEAGDFRGAPDISLCELDPHFEPGNVKRLKRLFSQLVAEETNHNRSPWAELWLWGDAWEYAYRYKRYEATCSGAGIRELLESAGSEKRSEFLKLYTFTLEGTEQIVKLRWHLSETDDTALTGPDLLKLCGGQVECPVFQTPLASLEQKSKADGLSLSSTIADFCKHYCLGEEICERLKAAGVKTAGELLRTSESTPESANFGVGHIAEVRWAAREMVYGSNTGTTMKTGNLSTANLSTATGGIGGAGGAGGHTGGDGGLGEAPRGFAEEDLKHFHEIRGGIGGKGGRGGKIDGSDATGETEAELQIMTPNASTELEVILISMTGGVGGRGGLGDDCGVGGAGGHGEAPSRSIGGLGLGRGAGEGPGVIVGDQSRDKVIKSCVVEVGEDWGLGGGAGGPGGTGKGPRAVVGEDMISGGENRDILVCLRICGGIGGAGGGGELGGSGGLGEAPQIRVREESYASCFFQLVGGTGGIGGDGTLYGGGGGTGGGVVLSKRLVSMEREARYQVSRLPLDKLDLKDRLRYWLYEHGFVTVGGLLEVYDTDLKEAGFKIGHIAGLKRALEVFLAKTETTETNR